MKTYRVSRPYVWFTTLAKLVYTAGGTAAYIAAVTNPTPLAARVLLLAALVGFGWLFFIRLPRMPRELAITPDGWVHFKGSQGDTRVHVASIRSIGRGLGWRSIRVRHGGGRVRLPNRFGAFYDFLATVKGMNPAIEIRGF